MKPLSYLALQLAFLGLALGCNESAPVKSARLPDGSWRLECKSSLGVCADRAEALCKDRGLTLLDGRSEHRLFGNETGSSQVEARSSELVVKCVERKGGAPPALAAEGPRLVRPAGEETTAHACVPGATQRCVGAGACSGGQACLADGSAFGLCDCGTASAAPLPPPPSAPAPAAPASGPAAP